MLPYFENPLLRTLLLTHAVERLKPGESRTLASGKVITYPNYYADLRLLATRPDALPLIANEIIARLPINARYVGGVPTGGLIPLGAVGTHLSWMTGGLTPIKLFYVRKEKKGHGQGKQVEGYLGTDGAAVFIEDVATSGKSLIEAIEPARAETGANITTAICVLDREMGAREALAKIGVELRPIFTASQLGLTTK